VQSCAPGGFSYLAINKKPRQSPGGVLIGQLRGKFRQSLAFFFDDLNHMRDLVDHAAHGWGIFQFPYAVHFVQAEADQRLALFGGTADRRTDLLYNDGFSHFSAP